MSTLVAADITFRCPACVRLIRLNWMLPGDPARTVAEAANRHLVLGCDAQ